MGAAVAAAAARARRETLEHFRLAGATRPEAAAPVPPMRWLARRQLARWERNGVVQAAPGGYWLDEAAYMDYAAARRRWALIVVAVALVVLAVGAVLAERIGRPL